MFLTTFTGCFGCSMQGHSNTSCPVSGALARMLALNRHWLLASRRCLATTYHFISHHKSSVCHIALHQETSCHTHITTKHESITSHHIEWSYDKSAYHVGSCHTTAEHVTSRHISDIPCHVMSCHVMSCITCATMLKCPIALCIRLPLLNNNCSFSVRYCLCNTHHQLPAQGCCTQP